MLLNRLFSYLRHRLDFLSADRNIYLKSYISIIISLLYYHTFNSPLDIRQPSLIPFIGYHTSYHTGYICGKDDFPENSLRDKTQRRGPGKYTRRKYYSFSSFIYLFFYDHHIFIFLSFIYSLQFCYVPNSARTDWQ